MNTTILEQLNVTVARGLFYAELEGLLYIWGMLLNMRETFRE